MSISTETVAEQLAPSVDVIARATALVPLIREHAETSSRERRVVPKVISELEQAGLFKIMVPERLGGLGCNLRTMMECVAEVGRGDGSTGWVTALLNVCTWFSTTFSDRAQEEVFSGAATPKVCGIVSAQPGLSCVRVEGGYQVSGRWAYSSGSFAADWAVLGLTLEDGKAALALFPGDAFRIDASWYVAGLQGTGSDTIVVEDQFVPDHRVQLIEDMSNGDFATSYGESERNSRMSFMPVAALILAGTQIGLARHALELTRERLPKKRVPYTAYEARMSPTHQLDVATAAYRFHLAELVMRQATEDIDTAAAKGESIDLLTRGRIRCDTGMMAELVKEGIDKLLTANGSSSFADGNVLGRIWRDSEIGGRHGQVMPELGKEVYGQILLGADEPYSTGV